MIQVNPDRLHDRAFRVFPVIRGGGSNSGAGVCQNRNAFPSFGHTKYMGFRLRMFLSVR